MFEQLTQNLYRMNDRNRATVYLLLGTEKAYAIDAGNGLDPLMPDIRAVTELPV